MYRPVGTYGNATTRMDTNRDVLEFDCGVRVYPPPDPDGYWRVRWEDAGRRRDTSARSRADAIAKATELVERLGRGTRTDLAKASGADLVANYLDVARRPPRGHPWSERHRDEQVRYCNLYVSAEIGLIACRRLTRVDFQRILDRAPTASVAQHLRRCLTGVVNAGLEEGHLLARQDLLRGVRWQPSGGTSVPETEAMAGAITEADIPTGVLTTSRRHPRIEAIIESWAPQRSSVGGERRWAAEQQVDAFDRGAPPFWP